MSIQTIESSDTTILYQLPLGKPNPKEKRMPGEDTRTRVLQAAQKGITTCVYYAQKRIRRSIGPNHDESLAKEREIEKTWSEYRKEYSKLPNSIIAFGVALTNNQPLPPGDQMKTYLEEYQMQCALSGGRVSPRQFCIMLTIRESGELAIRYLKKLNIDIKKVYEEEILDPKYEEERRPSWDRFITSEVTTRSTVITHLTNIKQAESYGLKRSEWRTDSTIDKLISVLKEHGPMAVGGKHGQGRYEDKPFKLQDQIGGRDIYGWKPGAKRIDSSLQHAVVVVGARQVGDKGYVYFIDPEDPSDPASTAKDGQDDITQKIYVASIKNFCDNTCNLHGTGPHTAYPAGFGFHSNLPIKPMETKLESVEFVFHV